MKDGCNITEGKEGRNMTGVVVVHAEAVSWGHCSTKRSRCRWNRVKGQVTLDPVWFSYLEFILRAVVAMGGVSKGAGTAASLYQSTHSLSLPLTPPTAMLTFYHSSSGLRTC